MDNSAWNLTNAGTKSDTRNIFEDCAWLYAFCREYLFRDHTEEIAQALSLSKDKSKLASILEVGCGPGFYSRRLALRFPTSRVIGIDRSPRMVAWAQARASENGLTNCSFLEGDVKQLSSYIDTVDAVISSRLLLIIADRIKVMNEIFRVLNPGGRLFLAEPTANFKTQVPLSAMRFVTCFLPSWRRQASRQNAKILARQDFENLVHSQPWSSVSIRMYDDYQCAICEKSAESPADNYSSPFECCHLAASGSLA